MKTIHTNHVAFWILAFVFLTWGAIGSGEQCTTVETWTGELTLPTYPWFDDVNPIFAELDDGIYYPYTRQDHLATKQHDRTYKAWFLENEYLKVTCLPELGGRIFSVLDKTTGQEMFHTNKEIKPALIAMRGAWISGGIEWNSGPHGHTVTVVSPVDVTARRNGDGSATLLIANTEKIFHTRWEVILTLHPGKAFLDETISIENPTDGTHPYYFWNCTAFPNLPGTRFIYPMTLGTDHAGTSFYSWPVHEGRDLSWLKNYPTMSSIFAYECVFDFFGSYDVDLDRGLVSYANHHELKGKKAWTWGKDDFGVVSQQSLSDAGPVHAQYIEVQSGPLLTQADYGMLEPRQKVQWQEFWYPVHGLGNGFEYATRDAAVQAKRSEQALELRLIGTGAFPEAWCSLEQGEKTLLKQPVPLSPSKAVTVTLDTPPAGPIRVRLLSKDGAELLNYETPLAIPIVTAPDLTKKPARPDGAPTADEKYLEGRLADSQSNPAAARTGYEAALALDPLHVASLLGLATLDIEDARYDDALDRARKAAARDPECGKAWYLLGVAQLQRGQTADAIVSGYKAAGTLDAIALGYALVGRACMRQGDYAQAVRSFERAHTEAPGDARTRACLAAARIAMGSESACPVQAGVPPLDFVLRAALALADEPSRDALLTDLGTICGEPEFNLLEIAAFYADLGLYRAAMLLLQDAMDGRVPGLKPCTEYLYRLAHYQQLAGEPKEAVKTLKKAAKLPADFVMPAGADSLAALQFAVDTRPGDVNARLLLGLALAGLHRMNEAIPCWEATVQRNPKLSVPWRLLARKAEKAGDLAQAEGYLRRAVNARPRDQVLYCDLARVLCALNRRTEAIRIVERMPKAEFPRFDIILWLAESYNAEKRYDDCIHLLESAQLSNWEGQTTPHDLFVAALLARGKLRFDTQRFAEALADFQLALTYPANLGVGAKYKLTDAELRYWEGKTLLALGRTSEARAAWETGAAQITSKDPDHLFITVSSAQDEHVQRCADALNELK